MRIVRKDPIREMFRRGRLCRNLSPKQENASRMLIDLPSVYLDENGKAASRKAKKMIAAWNLGFSGGLFPKEAKLRVTISHGRERVEVVSKYGESLSCILLELPGRKPKE